MSSNLIPINMKWTNGVNFIKFGGEMVVEYSQQTARVSIIQKKKFEKVVLNYPFYVLLFFFFFFFIVIVISHSPICVADPSPPPTPPSLGITSWQWCALTDWMIVMNNAEWHWMALIILNEWMMNEWMNDWWRCLATCRVCCTVRVLWWAGGGARRPSTATHGRERRKEEHCTTLTASTTRGTVCGWFELTLIESHNILSHIVTYCHNIAYIAYIAYITTLPHPHCSPHTSPSQYALQAPCGVVWCGASCCTSRCAAPHASRQTLSDTSTLSYSITTERSGESSLIVINCGKLYGSLGTATARNHNIRNWWGNCMEMQNSLSWGSNTWKNFISKRKTQLMITI